MRNRAQNTLCLSLLMAVSLSFYPAWSLVACSDFEITRLTQSCDESEPVDLGNKLCPVTGKPVDSQSAFIYKNSKHHLCSAECAVDFSKDPEGYSQKVAQATQEETTAKKSDKP